MTLDVSDSPAPETEIAPIVAGHQPNRTENARTAATIGLFLLAFIFAIDLAQAFVVPVVVALLLESLFRPMVRSFRKRGLPEPAGALIVLLGFLAVVGVGVYSLASPAAEWSVKGPASLGKVEAKIKRLLRPIERVQQTAARVEEVTASNGQPGESVRIRDASLFDRLSGSTLALVEGFFTAVFLAFFMLAAGDRFIQHTVELLPTLSDKKKAVRIARDIESQVSLYLATVTMMSVALGLISGGILAFLGMPNAGLWGFMAGLLNYVPYLGAFVTVIVIGIAALATFDSVPHALLMPLVFLVLHLLEANVFKPMILGRRLPLNETALFVGLLFWWFLWGTIGAILAVPILVAVKVFCDHVEMLQPLGSFLGKVPTPSAVADLRERAAS